ncbi:hypothetical protein PNEG_01328 [Pneumocystis murina B123]|uniref:Required for respiratory growth protein 9, mitochondrial n=1 Tax=Pneumocystis murina (strain B123) TaxID=1069680 RepID=M7P9S3_PNEMU|nr:hypothetical protein PNEG_01328 [Pneumocystis murina B123]EMR10625.1 hypothetical protein PNEG_01328 [Pneumocystis murina B123]
MFLRFFYKRNLNYKSSLLSKKTTDSSKNIQKRRNKWVLPSPLDHEEIKKKHLKNNTLSKTSYQSLLSLKNVTWKENKELPQWKKQKIALKEKFPEGWNPFKKLSPDTLNQIRTLRQQNPKYTASVLSEMYKVSPEAIRRILKSKWQPSFKEYADRFARWKKRKNRLKDIWISQKFKKDKF